MLARECRPRLLKIVDPQHELGVGGTVGEIDIDAGIGEPPCGVGQRAGAILNLDRHHLTNLADGKARRL